MCEVTNLLIHIRIDVEIHKVFLIPTPFFECLHLLLLE